jgi:hypothetical protein
LRGTLLLQGSEKGIHIDTENIFDIIVDYYTIKRLGAGEDITARPLICRM